MSTLTSTQSLIGRVADGLPNARNSLPRLPDLRLSTSPMGRGPRINYSEGHTLVRAAEAIATKFDLSMVGVEQ